MNFGVIYEGFEESQRELEEGQKVLNSTLGGIEVFVVLPVSQILVVLLKVMRWQTDVGNDRLTSDASLLCEYTVHLSISSTFSKMSC